MTMNSFNDISIGATEEEVIACNGQPFETKTKCDGTVKYVYIERLKAGGRDLEERKYILTLKEGKVVSKKIKYSSPAPYLFDSYEMQTTQTNHAPPSDE